MIRLTKIIKINNTKKYFILKHFCHTEASNNHHDIIVAGGGMVGSTMALALGKNSILNSKKVLLLEGRPQSKIALSETYSKRVSAITPTSVELFESLGAWKHIQQVRYAPVNCMQVWDGCSDAQITFNHDDFENLAYIVENNLILQSLEKELASLAAGENSSIKLFYGAKIKSYDLPTSKEGVAKVTLEDGTTFTCDLLIGADGANSRIRNAMGVHYVHWNYDQRSIVATLHLADDMPNTTAWQRFTPDGPIALLPLTSKLSSLVWSTTSENARKISKLPNDQFVDAVNEAFFKQFPRDQLVDNLSKGMTDLLTKLNVNQNNNVRQLPPQIEGVDEGSRAVFPVGFGHCSNYVNHGVALIGDAAHRVHPLAGQGVNLGFQDVALLTKLIEEAVYRGSKIGNFALLKEYERKSQINNVPTVFGIDALHKLYSTSFMPLVLVRSLGLQAVHSLPLVKKLIMKYAQR